MNFQVMDDVFIQDCLLMVCIQYLMVWAYLLVTTYFTQK